jgi:hypothetical protein
VLALLDHIASAWELDVRAPSAAHCTANLKFHQSGSILFSSGISAFFNHYAHARLHSWNRQWEYSRLQVLRLDYIYFERAFFEAGFLSAASCAARLLSRACTAAFFSSMPCCMRPYKRLVFLLIISLDRSFASSSYTCRHKRVTSPITNLAAPPENTHQMY